MNEVISVEGQPMSDCPLVSVIIPALNAAATVAQAIESIANQSYRNVEIIVVDNGSKDLTCDVVKELLSKDNRICLIESGRTGVSNARNIGMEAAKGNYIAFCDADDRMTEDGLCKLLEHKKDADIVAGGVYFDTISSEGDVVSSSPKMVKEMVCAQGKELGPYFEDLWERNYLQSCWSKIYSTNFIRQTGVRFDERLSSYEDLAFVLDCLSNRARFVAIPSISYRYSRSTLESNSTRYKHDMAEQMQCVAERVVTFYQEVLEEKDSASCTEHVVRMLTVAINNAQKTRGGLCAAKKAIADVFEKRVFYSATRSASKYPNRYSHMLVCLGVRRHYGAITLLATLRNLIRSVRVAK